MRVIGKGEKSSLLLLPITAITSSYTITYHIKAGKKVWGVGREGDRVQDKNHLLKSNAQLNKSKKNRRITKYYLSFQ